MAKLSRIPKSKKYPNLSQLRKNKFMNFKAYSIILSRQIKQKFGRFLLASGGIAVGVWAITLTNGLSAGFQSTVVTAINSQLVAREVQVFKTKDQGTSLFGSSSPTFVPQAISKWKQLQDQYPEIANIVTNDQLQLNVFAPNTDHTCATPQIVVTPPGIKPSQQQAIITKSRTNAGCASISASRTNLNNFYETNKSNWYGAQPKDFGAKDVAICYSCGKDVHNLWKVDKPQDLVGKTIRIEPTQGPRLYALDQDIKFDRNSVDSFVTSESVLQGELVEDYVIRAVIDDSQSSAIDLTGSNSSIYVPDTLFQSAFDKANPGSNIDEFGVIGVRITTKDYKQLEPLNTALSKQYFTFSTGLLLVQGVGAAFQVVNGVLFAFGLIAIIASVFGIVNVMAISVLERRKEIGILKALGAPDRSIFALFLSESAVLGVLGWCLGTLIAVGMGYGASGIFNWFVQNNTDFRKNLETFNITSFSPEFGVGLLGFTFLLAIVFTTLSGLLPSLSAARQNPAEVMRSE
jgi:ABC-type lipoprotein release transport system permease subunit